MDRVRVIAPDFEAEFESDGRVRKASPRLCFMLGWSEDRAGAYLDAKGWSAEVVEPDEAEIARLAAIDEAYDDPLVAAVLECFPDAEVVDVRFASRRSATAASRASVGPSVTPSVSPRPRASASSRA